MVHITRAGIIWDLDHTLYESNDRILHSWIRALARTAVSRGHYPDTDVAFDALYRSFLNYGHALTQLSRDCGIDERAFVAETFPANRANFESIQFIEACDITLAAMTTHRGIPQALVTSALREWAEQVLAHLRLDLHFPADRIIALEDADYQSKALSLRPYELASAALKLPLEALVMVEDNVNNLKMAKDLGLATILVTHGDALPEHPVHVDFVVNKAYDVFDLITSGEIPWQK
jgi:phosphoglycolate phosphatase-like HAD superfamily hydrolase